MVRRRCSQASRTHLLVRSPRASAQSVRGNLTTDK
nr:MAG TPA_asm: hypothetical protein [Caudoviricetes sp.]